MSTLVIGAAPGGIGYEIMRQSPGEVIAPSIDNFDVMHRDSMESWFKHKGKTFDRVVFCAGVNLLGKIGELDEYNIYHSFRVNVIGFINMLDALKRWQGDSPVSVVAIVSDSAHTPMRGSIAYSSSKAALAQAIRCAARELAPAWRVNGISPSVVEDTPMTRSVDAVVPALRGWSEEKAMEYELSLIPMGRRATKSEVARLTIDVLSGPEFLTGAIIPITGGK